MDKVKFLKGTDLFCDLSEEELSSLISELTVVEFEPDDVIFSEGDAADAAYLVIDGRVELVKALADDVEKTVYVAESGAFFGEMGMLEREMRSASAVAREPVHLIRLGDDLFRRILDKDPLVAVKILKRIAGLLSHRLRITTELYSSAVKWGLEVSGARGLNFHDLIDDHRTLTFGLRGGKRFTGAILRVEASMAGHEVTVKTSAGPIVIIPYHAIEYVDVATAAASDNGSSA